MVKRLLPLLLAGCSASYDPCFPPPSTVDALRILALRLDPPEVLYDPASPQPMHVVLTPLVADVTAGSNLINVRARLCVSDGRCPDSTPWATSALGQFDNPSQLDLDVDPALVAAAIAHDPLHGYGGARITVDVEAAANNQITAATKLLIANPNAPGYVPNHNFEIPGITALRTDTGAQFVAGGPNVVEVDVGQGLWLSPQLAASAGATDAAETYVVTDLSGHTATLRERISYSFYVTPHAQYGPIGKPEQGADVADEPAPGDPRPPFGLVLLAALKEAPGRVYVVGRDGRGGEAFAWFDIQMTEKRACSLESRCALLEVGCL